MNYQTNSRWARYGPYYAMFPVDFAFDVIQKYSSTKTRVLDPFAGRGTSIYAATTLGREAVGIEINPVGWVYGKTKLKPAKKKSVLNRLEQISHIADAYKPITKTMPDFFKVCFYGDVLAFLLAARDNLNWRKSHVDRTLISFILYYLHNNIGQGLSNQMKQTISMSPNYSLRWWYANGYSTPPKVDPVNFLRKKIEWRYEKGMPEISAKGKMFLGDSENVLNKVKNQIHPNKKFSLLLTSPPYCSVVNYHSDQWLRLWVLGGETSPKTTQKKNAGRFDSKQQYHKLLMSVFSKCANLMDLESVIYVRTDVRSFTFDCTKEVLTKCFPEHVQRISHSSPKNSQSQLYKNTPLIKPGERDIILTRG